MSAVRTRKPLPPVLEPFTFLIGGWRLNYTQRFRYPVDLPLDDVDGYDEYLEFAVAEVPMFGTPSINYRQSIRKKLNPQSVFSSIALSRRAQHEGFERHGFLTLNTRGPKDRPEEVKRKNCLMNN